VVVVTRSQVATWWNGSSPPTGAVEYHYLIVDFDLKTNQI